MAANAIQKQTSACTVRCAPEERLIQSRKYSDVLASAFRSGWAAFLRGDDIDSCPRIREPKSKERNAYLVAFWDGFASAHLESTFSPARIKSAEGEQ